MKKWLAIMMAAVLLLGMLPEIALAEWPSKCPKCGSGQIDPIGSECYQPTCTKDGKAVLWCANCGDVTQTYPALGHSWGDWTVREEATCASEGTRVRYCERCQEAQTEPIAKTSHTWGAWAVVTPATCAKEGKRERACAICGKTESEAIARVNHTMGEWKEITPATCAKEGKRQRACVDCGQTESEATAKVGHTWGEWVLEVKPTCDKEGVEKRPCKVCDASETRKVPTTEHQFTKWQVTKEPTCKKTGLEKSTCSICGATKKKKLDKIDHNWVEETLQEMTPFSTGIVQRKCTMCGAKTKDVTYPQGTLKKGDKGDDVTRLQDKLAEKGYSCGKKRGTFGDSTVKAVKKFQKDHGMKADGIAWPGMIALLFDETPAPEATEAPEQTENLLLLEAGMAEPISAHAGDVIDVDLTVTNLSGAYINVNAMSAQFADNTPDEAAQWMIVEDDDHSLSMLAPEAPFAGIVLSLTVSEDDLAAGAITRRVRVGAKPWGDEATGARMTVADQYAAPVMLDAVLYSNPVEVTIPLVPAETEDVALALSGTAVTDSSVAVGDVFETELKIENVGKVALSSLIIEFTVLDADKNVIDSGTVKTWFPEEELALGGELTVPFSYTIPETATMDEIMIAFTASCASTKSAEDTAAAGWTILLDLSGKKSDGEPAIEPIITPEPGSHKEGDPAAKTIDDFVIPANPNNPFDDPMIPFGEITDLTVEKQEVTVPENGRYYTDGELIGYTITVTNSGESIIQNVRLMDVLEGIDGEPVAEFGPMLPGESVEVKYLHQVNKSDVEKGTVVNCATAIYTVSDIYVNARMSNIVVSRTNAQEKQETRSGLLLPLHPGADSCRLVLEAKGDDTAEYTLHTCTLHQPTADRVNQLVAQAETPEQRVQAWQTARTLWQEQADQLYAEACDAATSAPARMTVINEKTLFYAQLDAYEKLLRICYPEDEETVARLVAEAMRDKCTGLCYELNTAPAARVDSYTDDIPTLASGNSPEQCAVIVTAMDVGGDVHYQERLCSRHSDTELPVLSMVRGADTLDKAWSRAQKLWLADLDEAFCEIYNAAEGDDRLVIAAARMTFDNWVDARRSFLEMIYEGKPAVEEVVNKTLMNRVIDLCRLP